MAWRWPGDKPLSEPMMASLLTPICITQPQWVKYVSIWWDYIIHKCMWDYKISWSFKGQNFWQMLVSVDSLMLEWNLKVISALIFFIPKWIISKDIIVLTVFVWYQSISSLFVCCEPANHSLIWLSSWWLVYNSLSFSLTNLYHYCQTSNVRHTLAGNKIVGQSDVVGALLFVAAPTTSSFFT